MPDGPLVHPATQACRGRPLHGDRRVRDRLPLPDRGAYDRHLADLHSRLRQARRFPALQRIYRDDIDTLLDCRELLAIAFGSAAPAVAPAAEPAVEAARDAA